MPGQPPENAPLLSHEEAEELFARSPWLLPITMHCEPPPEGTVSRIIPVTEVLMPRVRVPGTGLPPGESAAICPLRPPTK
jgi:hypothetical protein